MATIATRLYSTGVYAVNGEFDEFTGVPIVDSSLQLWLDAGQSSSYSGLGTTWTDLSGNGRNGTLTNAPTYSSENGGYFTFDGSNDFVQCSGSLTVTAATFIIWIRRNGPQDSYDGILYSRSTLATGISFFGTTNKISYTWNSAGQTFNWDSGLTVPNLTWCMIAVSVTGTTATAYLCQSSGITSATNPAGYNHTSTVLDDINIGQDDTGGRFFSGAISTAMIYDRALSAEEIATNFNALAGRFGIAVVGRARSRITANTVQATEFDEVTYNNSTSFTKRENVNGNVQVTGIFDELTSAPIADSSLVYWLDAGQTASYPGSGTTATDLSGQAVTSTLTGNVEYSSFNAGYLTFDGNHDYITTSSEFANANYLFADANGAWTVNTWFQFSRAPTTTRTGNQAYMVVGRGGGIATGATFGIFVGSASDTTYGSYAPHRIGVVSRGTVNIISNSSANTGAWNNATVTWDGTTGNIYYNGSFVNTLNTSVAAVLQTYNVAIGTQANSASTFIFEGNISTVSIYNRSLSADEVAQNFNALRRRYNV